MFFKTYLAKIRSDFPYALSHLELGEKSRKELPF